MIDFIYIIACSVLAIEIAYMSTLALDIKKVLKIEKVPEIVNILSNIVFWNRLLSKYLFPINLTFAIFFTIYKKIIEMINCPYCLSFHLGWLSQFLLNNNDIKISLVYGLITIFFTHIIEKIYDY